MTRSFGGHPLATGKPTPTSDGIVTLFGLGPESFAAPIAANTVYIVAYHTTAGYIAYSPGGLNSTINNPPLHALGNGVDGGDGVYSYDAVAGTPVFPSHYNGQAPNYYVDVVFVPNTSPPPSVTIFSPIVTPYNANVYDSNIASAGGVDVGIKFESTQAGVVDGVRFYKGAQDTGVQIGELWSSSGILLATAAFTSETASGWQQVNFSNPVAIDANTVYIISYHTTSPYIAYTKNGLASTITNGPLSALGNGVDGVYSYDVSPEILIFPDSYNGQAPNYLVDVVFTPST